MNFVQRCYLTLLSRRSFHSSCSIAGPDLVMSHRAGSEPERLWPGSARLWKATACSIRGVHTVPHTDENERFVWKQLHIRLWKGHAQTSLCPVMSGLSTVAAVRVWLTAAAFSLRSSQSHWFQCFKLIRRKFNSVLLSYLLSYLIYLVNFGTICTDGLRL